MPVERDQNVGLKLGQGDVPGVKRAGPAELAGALPGPSSAPDDPSPLVGVQLVRPRRCAAAGAPAGPLPHGDVTQGSCEEDPEEQSGQPGDAVQVTGLNRYALLTPVAPMGADERVIGPARQ
jgi:hypothetical protein